MEGEKEMEGGRNERTKEGKSRKGRKEREREEGTEGGDHRLLQEFIGTTAILIHTTFPFYTNTCQAL